MTVPQLTVYANGATPVSGSQFNTFVQGAVNVANLRAFVGVPGFNVTIQGFTTAGDGGAGSFYWNATSTGPDDGNNVIVPTGSVIGAWIRLNGGSTFSSLTVTGLLTAGSLALTGSVHANYVLAAPNAANGAPTFRQLIASDIPTLAPLSGATFTGPVTATAFTATTGGFTASAGNIVAVGGSGRFGSFVEAGAAGANQVFLLGSTTGTPVIIAAEGSDTNVGMNFLTQGIGPYGFYTANGRQFAIGDSGGTAANYVSVLGALTGNPPGFVVVGTDTNISLDFLAKGTGSFGFANSNGTQFAIVNGGASTVNYVAAVGGQTGVGPGFVTFGTDTNISFNIASKGTGNIGLFTGNGLQFDVQDAGASTINFATAAGATTGNPVRFGAAGSNTNIGINIAPKGTGAVTIPTGNLVVSSGLLQQTVTTVLAGGPVPSINGTTYVTGPSSNGVTAINLLYIEDGIAVTGTAMGLYIDHIVNGASAAGSRAGLQVGLAVTANMTGATGQFFTNIYSTTVGTANGNAGNLFGSAEEVHLNTGATNWNSVVGREIDIAVETGVTVAYKAALQIVQLSDDAVAGSLQDTALSFGTQSAGTPPRWKNLIAAGGPQGWWPVAATGTILGTVATVLGGPSYTAGYGVDFSAVTFATAFLKSVGFSVSGNGSMARSSADSLVAHAGGGQTNALALTCDINRITTCATNGDSVRLPVSVPGLMIAIINDGAATCQVYGAGTDTIDGVATATGVTLSNARRSLFFCETAGAWQSAGMAKST